MLQKLLKYFNGTIILTSFALSPAGVLPVIFNLDLNDSAKLLLDSSFCIVYFTFTTLFLSSACLAAASSLASVIVIVPLTSMYASA